MDNRKPLKRKDFWNTNRHPITGFLVCSRLDNRRTQKIKKSKL